MTEAAHQTASNPLHGVRKPGSVGLAAGPEVAIMDENGNLLGAGEVGEIVIRGDNVTAGYENNPKANAEAFVNGWFRTGDQGVKEARRSRAFSPLRSRARRSQARNNPGGDL
jgi:acyl-CoA synthetase (AMP-forming)/AMP-acid ligase II